MKSLLRKTVLVVDDEPEIREIIGDELREHQIKVLEASNGNEAYHLVQNTPIGLVIADIRMPNGDGFSLLRKIREFHPDIPFFVFITGHSEITTNEAASLGAKAVFKKPFKVHDVTTSVLMLLNEIK